MFGHVTSHPEDNPVHQTMLRPAVTITGSDLEASTWPWIDNNITVVNLWRQATRSGLELSPAFYLRPFPDPFTPLSTSQATMAMLQRTTVEAGFSILKAKFHYAA